MKPYLNLLLIPALTSAAISTGCGGAKENKTDVVENTDSTATTNADIRGQWLIENIVFNDSDYVRPDEIVSGNHQYIVFKDSTYFVMTNCNSISGTYAVKGNNISLGDGAMTEMACDNMDTEDALRRIIPHISKIDIQNDSVVRLGGSVPAECILLRKAKDEIK